MTFHEDDRAQRLLDVFKNINVAKLHFINSFITIFLKF